MLNKLIQYQNKPLFCFALILTAVCFVMLHLPLMGIPLGADLTQHLQFASTYQFSMLSGDFFPGWAPSDNYGFGSIGIRFYPPLAYYLMAFTQMLIGDWYDTFWTNAFFWMLVGAIGMYFWTREWLSPIESAFAAIFYTFSPYHRYQIYHFILFAEFAAAGILPFCFLALTKVIRRGKPVDVIFFSVTLALLILTHIPTTVLGILGLAIYGLMLMDWKNFRPIFWKLTISGSLGLLASSYHWLRLVTEMNWVKHTAENFTVDFYDFRKHLFPLEYKGDLFTPPIDSAIILLFLSLLPLAIYFLIRLKTKWQDKSEQKIAFALIVTGAICLFLTTTPSLLVWENVPLIQKVQFPWRWLSVGYLMASFAFVLSISGLYKVCQNMNKLFVLVPTIIFSLIFIFFVVKTTHSMLPLNRENFAVETKGLEDRRGCSCWMPIWANPSTALKNKERISSDSRQFSINKWESESREFEIEPGTSQKIRVGTFYYPLWHTEINGKTAEIEKGEDGSILLPIGEEKSVVKLNFQEPLMLQLALAGSLLTWLFLLILLFQFYRKNLNPTKVE